MRGKTVVVTGATSGLGEQIALEIAGKGANVIVVSRSEAKCQQTVAQITSQTGNASVSYMAADLSVQSEVRALADRLNQSLTRLDVLVNNAGAWFNTAQKSEDGVEMTWALNHLNYFLLTNGVLDLMKRTAAEHGEARIINQASGAHHEGKLNWDNLNFEGTFDTEGKGSVGPGWGAYSQSKLANVVHAFKLARDLEGTGVAANAVHPGVVVTGFASNNGLIYRIARPFRKLFNRTPTSHGAAPAVYLATAPEAKGVTGTYYGPLHTEEPVNPIANDIEAQNRLWSVSLEQTTSG